MPSSLLIPNATARRSESYESMPDVLQLAHHSRGVTQQGTYSSSLHEVEEDADAASGHDSLPVTCAASASSGIDLDRPLRNAHPILEHSAARPVPQPSHNDENDHDHDELMAARRTSKIMKLLTHLTSSNLAYTTDCLLRLIHEPPYEGSFVLWTVSKCICHTVAQRDGLVEVLAGLSSSLVERLNDSAVHDERMKDRNGVPLAGGQLFRSHLLRCCEAAFRIRLAAHGVHDSTQIAGHEDDIAIARRQGPGLLRFIGQLFNAGLLVDRVIHSCLHALLQDPDLLSVKSIEDAYVLLTVSGRALDSAKAHQAVDSYLSRIRTHIEKNPKGSWRIRSMLEELVELRQIGWCSRPVQEEPS